MRDPARTADVLDTSGDIVALRSGTAVWMGDARQGFGFVSTGSGALQSHPYTVDSRFNGSIGTSPEELIAVAHASSFTMYLALILAKAHFVVDHIETTALLTLEKDQQGLAISRLHLVLAASAPVADDLAFQALVARASKNCAVSKLLNAKITVDARLIGRN
jgi:osmotically inducible protein OsmC